MELIFEKSGKEKLENKLSFVLRESYEGFHNFSMADSYMIAYTIQWWFVNTRSGHSINTTILVACTSVDFEQMWSYNRS